MLDLNEDESCNMFTKISNIEIVEQLSLRKDVAANESLKLLGRHHNVFL